MNNCQLIAGWSTELLRDVLQKTSSIDPRKSPSDEFEYIDVSSVSRATFSIENTSRLKGVDAPSRARRHVKSGDVLFATIRPTLQRIAIVPDHLNDEVCSTGYFILRPKAKVDNRFLYYYLFTKPFVSEMERKQKGASYPAVNDGDVREQLISFPPLPEQKRIVAILDEAFAGISLAVANAEKNLANARELFESYLNNVFTQNNEGWEETTLGNQEVLRIIDGDRGKNYPKKSDFLDEGYCLFLSTKNVRPDGFKFDSLMFISEDKDKSLRKGRLQRRDVLLTTRGTIGNLALYDENVEYENVHINSGMLIFRPNEDVITSEYLFEVMRSSIIKEQIKKYTSGAAQPQLPINTLINFVLPVPKSIKEQEKIVSDLHALSEKTQKLEAIYQQKLSALNELKQSILQKAFVGQLTRECDNG